MYKHPRALDSVEGHPPAAVDLGGETVGVDEDGKFETDDEGAVERLARRYGVDVSELKEIETCDVLMENGEICGREKPCPYHD